MTAEAFVDRLASEVVGILSDSKLDRPARVAALRGALDRSFDLAVIARTIAGRHWRAMSPTQRGEYTGLFDRLISKAMAERIGRYGGETFTLTRSRRIDEHEVMVGTVIRRPSGGPAWAIDWRVREGPQGHRLIDVVAEGVSLVLTQRAEADGIVQQAGVEGLIEEMRRRSRSPDGAVTGPSLQHG